MSCSALNMEGDESAAAGHTNTTTTRPRRRRRRRPAPNVGIFSSKYIRGGVGPSTRRNALLSTDPDIDGSGDWTRHDFHCLTPAKWKLANL